MNGPISGSLISARQTVNILPLILIFVSVAVIAIVIFVISKIIHDYKNSPEYIQKIKNRPLTQKDVKNIAVQCKLTREEAELLWKICYENQATNILILTKDKEMFDDLLKSEFYELKTVGDEKKISVLFSLRKKLFTSFVDQFTVKSTKMIGDHTNFVFTAHQGTHYNLAYPEKTADGLYFYMPEQLLLGDDRPDQLQKIGLSFIAKDGTAYKLETRVMRYQKDKTGKTMMVCAHTDRLEPLAKRSSDRIDMELNIQFAAVKAINHGTEKKPDMEYKINERRYPGTLLDISAGGCRLVTKLPIKPNQHIYIEGMFNQLEVDHAIGLILRNTRRKDGLIILHIKFVSIDLPVVNRILALAYNY